MLYSQLFGKTLKIVPAEAETVSHKLLLKAGFLDRALTAGVYTLLPLGWRVYKKIENIIREEMDRIGCQELLMPTLQPKALWQETNRWLKYDPPLFKLKDRHQKDLCLAPTHEEVITDLVRRFVTSYKDLPLYLYHIQNKFRNEMRPSGGLLRTREFMMKDLYSFHQDKKDLDQFYTCVIEAYKNIFRRCHLVVKLIEASGGSIGGEVTHEFNMLCPTGEDKVLYCPKCDFAANSEIYHQKKCKKCQTVLVEGRGIENGHIFKLDTRYAQAMNAYYVDACGRKQLLWMGCYGIGLQRLLATIVEAHHDEKGIIWPKTVAPYQVHLIQVGHEGLKEASFAHKIYQKLIEEKIEVLYDDREVSPGVKFSDADLLGLPIRLVVSERTAGRVEWKERTKEKKELLSLGQLIKRLKEKN